MLRASLSESLAIASNHNDNAMIDVLGIAPSRIIVSHKPQRETNHQKNGVYANIKIMIKTAAEIVVTGNTHLEYRQ